MVGRSRRNPSGTVNLEENLSTGRTDSPQADGSFSTLSEYHIQGKKRMRKELAALATIVLAMGLEGLAQDWPQFFGPERNGVYSGPELSETWGPDGPPLVWMREVGEGFSGPVVADGRLEGCRGHSHRPCRDVDPA